MSLHVFLDKLELCKKQIEMTKYDAMVFPLEVNSVDSAVSQD